MGVVQGWVKHLLFIRDGVLKHSTTCGSSEVLMLALPVVLVKF